MSKRGASGPHEVSEVHYRLGQSLSGTRPGGHPGRSLGSGFLFAGHRRLLDHPDPRRLDVRASLRDPRGDWMVRLARQPVAARIQVLADVSASMHIGHPRRKLDVVADLVASLALSSFRAGDLLGLAAFDGLRPQARDDLFWPAGRRAGDAISPRLRTLPPPAAVADPQAAARGLLDAAQRVGGRDGLVFLVSDFHGLDDGALQAALDALAPARVVPMLAWHPEERRPPSGRGLVTLDDAEQAGPRRSFWLRPSLTARWQQAVTARHQHLTALFAAREAALYDLLDEDLRFDAERLTRYFLPGAPTHGKPPPTPRSGVRPP